MTGKKHNHDQNPQPEAPEDPDASPPEAIDEEACVEGEVRIKPREKPVGEQADNLRRRAEWFRKRRRKS
ncbi:MAG TPA: hypothetical protein VGD27_03270 [Longimicrobiales bacterium]